MEELISGFRYTIGDLKIKNAVCLLNCNFYFRHSEDYTCTSGIVLHTPVSQDSTGLAVTLDKEQREYLIDYFTTYPSLREQRERYVRMTHT
ncbi:MAG: hypothetical protein P9L95_05750 [Candidatus Tenebribacter mawsonii]|nr:hypothetical protein [Candidatus Tenebribacter mawsonii]